MSTSFDAVYENGVLRPQQPIDLAEGASVRVMIVSPTTDSQSGPEVTLGDWLQRIEDKHGLVEGPEDWSENHDRYIYGDLCGDGDEQANRGE